MIEDAEIHESEASFLNLRRLVGLANGEFEPDSVENRSLERMITHHNNRAENWRSLAKQEANRTPPITIRLSGHDVSIAPSNSDEVKHLIDTLRASSQQQEMIPSWLRRVVILSISTLIGFLGGMFAGGAL